MPRVSELARPPRTLPATGLGLGWEPAGLFLITLLLLSFGLVTLYSTSAVIAERAGLPGYYFVQQQSIAAIAGLFLLTLCAHIPYRMWKRWAWPLMFLALLTLVIVILPFTEGIAPRINGSRRWIRLAGVRVQPSELAKLAVVVWTAGLAVRKQHKFRRLSQGLLPFLVVWSAVLLLIAAEPDLSTAALIAIVALTIVFAAGARVGHFIFLAVLALPLLLSQLAVGFRAGRVAAFLTGGDLSGAGYQVHQSLIALGSGGVAGVGFAAGRQKFGFLPEPHTDFMFSMIGEEWGFLGVFCLVAMYGLLILVGFRVARRAPDLFGELLAIGLTGLVAVHAVLHMFVGLGLVPSTGLPLPLISFGRSNLVVTLAAVGILMSVARGRGGLSARRG